MRVYSPLPMEPEYLMRSSERRGRRNALLLLALLLPALASGARLQLRIEATGEDLTGALVLSLHSPQAAEAVVPVRALMNQRDRQFSPELLVIPIGSTVEFPNSDDIRHHVYSFSPARRFELPLYSGSAAEPVQFPTAGVVALGCNIHDWMQAHILVMDTPHVRQVALEEPAQHWMEAPAGDYTLRIWHARMDLDPPWVERALSLREGQTASETIALALRAAEPPPLSEDAQLRALQERFRALRKEP